MILREDLPQKSTMPISEIKYKAKLDQNESPFDIPIEIKEKLFEEFKKLNSIDTLNRTFITKQKKFFQVI